MKNEISYKQLFSELEKLGLKGSNTVGKEIWVRFPNAKPGEGYFANDKEDALATGRAMVAERKAKAVNPEGDTRETFAQYLKRVGEDHAKSGAEFTAKDYATASLRIQDLESKLALINDKLTEVLNSRQVDSTLPAHGIIRSARAYVIAGLHDSHVFAQLSANY